MWDVTVDIPLTTALKEADEGVHERQKGAYDACNPKLEDFEPFGNYSQGQGAYGMVPVVRHKATQKFSRIKLILKQQLVDDSQDTKSKLWLDAIYERDIMKKADSPQIVKLLGSFKNDCYICYIMENQDRGDLRKVEYTLLRNGKRLKIRDVIFYAAQVITALEYIHSIGAVYRDMKPENVMIDYLGYAKLGDFGYTKDLPAGGRLYTLLGTPGFMAPELYEMKGVSYNVDLWAFGVLLFEMFYQNCPFGEPGETSEKIIMSNVTNIMYNIPDDVDAPEHFKDLITHHLLVRSEKRYQNAKEVKEHPLFQGFTWDAMLERQMKTTFTTPLKRMKKPAPESQVCDWGSMKLETSEAELHADLFANF